MNRFFLSLPAFLICLLGSSCANTPANPLAPSAPLVWKLDNPAEVGGHRAEVLGSPVVMEEAGAKALVFNGQSDGLILTTNPVEGLKQFTIEVLIKPDRTGSEEQRFIHIEDPAGRRIMLETRINPGAQWSLDTYLRTDQEKNRALLDRTKQHSIDQWHWVALVYDGKIMAHFIDGKKELEGPVEFMPMIGGRISIGVRQNQLYWYKGAIRELRFHSVALESAALQRPTDK